MRARLVAVRFSLAATIDRKTKMEKVTLPGVAGVPRTNDQYAPNRCYEDMTNTLMVATGERSFRVWGIAFFQLQIVIPDKFKWLTSP